ncbi:hypothetical protein K1719_044887 [Acacia pycnantha]|nr:hypothetical protein K1719_044887 [Acacia pycnantha]
MTTAHQSNGASLDSELGTQLLNLDTVNGAVDYKGQPVIRSKSGYWRSAGFIIGVESTAVAAANVNIWDGTASFLPLLGAFIADSYLGRYRTIVISSLLYILGLAMLTLAAKLPSFTDSDCKEGISLVFRLLGLINLMNAIQKNDNLSWVLGFGIPCIAMIAALILFLLGTKTYRFTVEGQKRSPFIRIGRVFVAAIRNRQLALPEIAFKDEAGNIVQCSKQFNFLNKALFSPNGSKQEEACSLNEVEDAKAVLGLAPIWAACLVFGIVLAQTPTFFTKQGSTMDRTIFPGFDIPAASLQALIPLAIVIFTLIYDRIFVPIARAITNKPSGITMLQRIGTGIFISVITVVIAALVEIKRQKTAIVYGLVDDPDATIPMSVSWLVPNIFCLELLSFLSSFLISVIEEATGKDEQGSWFGDNLNKAHLDYFYWLLVGLSVMGLALFIFFAKSYIYNQKSRAQG